MSESESTTLTVVNDESPIVDRVTTSRFVLLLLGISVVLEIVCIIRLAVGA